jgi:hypothetical protein
MLLVSLALGNFIGWPRRVPQLTLFINHRLWKLAHEAATNIFVDHGSRSMGVGDVAVGFM